MVIITCYLHIPPLSPQLPVYEASSYVSLKEREEENIQKRDCPCLGPSFRNSWPRGFSHLPHETLRAEGDSSLLERLSGFTVSVKAGQGDECSNFLVLWNRSFPHLEHT